MKNAFHIAVLPGDGIGQEVTPAALAVADAALQAAGAPGLHQTPLVAGAQAYLDTGTDFSDEAKRVCEAADAIYLGAMGLPAVRRDSGTEIAPQIELRFMFDLYAGVRPTRAIPGVPTPLAAAEAADIDFVLIRESTEGLFATAFKGTVEDDKRAVDTQVITRATTEKLSHFAFRLAERRTERRHRRTGSVPAANHRSGSLPAANHEGGSAPAADRATDSAAAAHRGTVTLIDKANVFVSFAFMRKVFDEVAAQYPATSANHVYVDASTLASLGKPWSFDVLVTENMFGDILSDLAAGLVGGMGYAPSADIGDTHAVFQPAHGSAPDIMGTGKANPTAAILSAAMMLDWLAERHDVPAMADAATLIHRSVDSAFRERGLRTCELGGTDGVTAVTDAVLGALAEPARA